MKSDGRTFCTKCREITDYRFNKSTIEKEISGRKYRFLITSAICNKCGNEINVPGLIDQNVKEISDQYEKLA